MVTACAALNRTGGIKRLVHETLDSAVSMMEKYHLQAIHLVGVYSGSHTVKKGCLFVKNESGTLSSILETLIRSRFLLGLL
jgi:hypothetical protein